MLTFSVTDHTFIVVENLSWCTFLIVIALSVLAWKQITLDGVHHLGLSSLSDKTSYGKILWTHEAAVLGVKIIKSLWNLTGVSAAMLPNAAEAPVKIQSYHTIPNLNFWPSRHCTVLP